LIQTKEESTLRYCIKNISVQQLIPISANRLPKEVVKKWVPIRSGRKTDDTLQISNYNNRVFTRSAISYRFWMEKEINVTNHWPSRSGGEKKVRFAKRWGH
jgi:hypothetical protein